MTTHDCKTKRSCRICKAEYARKYRADGRYKEKEKARAKKILRTPQSFAKSKVFLEVRAGRMAKAKEFKCVDCNRQAEVYDHRDYAKPLDVNPVCRSCNARRGPAINL